MGILSLVRLFAKFVKAGDLIAFIVSAGAGYLLATILPEGPWTAYIFIFISYHMFLAWLIIDSEKKGLSMPIPEVVLTHAACLALIIFIAFGRHSIPFFGFLRFGIAGLAFFERSWLFKGNAKAHEAAKASESKQKEKVVKRIQAKAPVNLVSAETALSEATLEDSDEWLRHLSQPDRPYRRAGLSVREEYELWLIARVSARHALPSTQDPT